MNKIVLFGATGYTGRSTAHALTDLGLKPVLAGRNKGKLEKLAGKLGGLDTAIADITNSSSVASLVEKGDVLISTVGPFTLYGEPALRAAVERGAHYIDSTGEPGFIRKVFEDYGPKAHEKGIALITACGYDYVPGNCAAGMALEKAGKDAVRVDVGYYITGRNALDMSKGTAASTRNAILEPGKIWRSGNLKECYSAAGVRTFTLGGRKRAGILLPSTEGYSLPHVYRQLTDVNVYLGWYGWMSYPMCWGATLANVLMKIPGYKAMLGRLIKLFPESDGSGPDDGLKSETGSHIVAEAFDITGRMLARAELLGGNGYDFTFRMLAWTASMVMQGSLRATGALGPIEAFGLHELIEGCRLAGLQHAE